MFLACQSHSRAVPIPPSRAAEFHPCKMHLTIEPWRRPVPSFSLRGGLDCPDSSTAHCVRPARRSRFRIPPYFPPNPSICKAAPRKQSCTAGPFESSRLSTGGSRLPTPFPGFQTRHTESHGLFYASLPACAEAVLVCSHQPLLSTCALAQRWYSESCPFQLKPITPAKISTRCIVRGPGITSRAIGK